MNTQYPRALVRVVGAAAVAFLVTAGGAGAAHAASDLVDPDALGSITIHKLEYPDTALDLPANGVEQVIPDGVTPMPEVTFTVAQVTSYDLSTNAGWADVQDLTPARAAAEPLGSPRSLTTGPTGVVAFTDLPIGVYLVTETAYPAGVTPVAPFLVTVPITDPVALDTWVYDVHVYPKDPVTAAHKSVTDSSAARFGDPVVFTITGDIPEVDVIDGYKVVDVIDAKLTFVNAQVTLTDGAALKPSDYTVTHDAGTVTVLFTTSGRETLAAHSEASVRVVITTTVNAVGEIDNEAYVYPNAASFTAEPGTPTGPVTTNEVETRWGNVTIKKTAQGSEAGLGGAVFAIYGSEADARKGVDPIQTSTALPGTGLWTFSGLRYSGWADGAAVAPGDDGYRTYWIAEVRAPKGYRPLTSPVEVVVDSTDDVVDYTIRNVPLPVRSALPTTGGVALGAAAAAVALMGVGSAVLVARRRRELGR